MPPSPIVLVLVLDLVLVVVLDPLLAKKSRTRTSTSTIGGEGRMPHDPCPIGRTPRSSAASESPGSGGASPYLPAQSVSPEWVTESHFA
jgi:hypothetical protein